MNTYFFIKQLLVITGVILSIATTSVSASSVSKFEYSELMKDLNDCPAWAGAKFTKDGGIDPTEAKDLMSVLDRVANLNKSDARTFIQQFLVEPRGLDKRLQAWSKIYVFNRLYYMIPSKLSNDKLPIFGMWIHLNSNASAIWPLDDVEGKLLLRYPYSGYAGPPYQALAEFDYLGSRFPIRNLGK